MKLFNDNIQGSLEYNISLHKCSAFLRCCFANLNLLFFIKIIPEV